MGSSNCCACGTSTRFQVQQPSYINNTFEHGGCCHGSRNYCCSCSNNSCFGMGTCLGCYRCCGGSSTSIYLPPPVPIYRQQTPVVIQKPPFYIQQLPISLSQQIITPPIYTQAPIQSVPPPIFRPINPTKPTNTQPIIISPPINQIPIPPIARPSIVAPMQIFQTGLLPQLNTNQILNIPKGTNIY